MGSWRRYCCDCGDGRDRRGAICELRIDFHFGVGWNFGSGGDGGVY